MATLLIQFLLVGFGLRLILHALIFSPKTVRPYANTPPQNQGHDGFRFHPDQTHKEPWERQVDTDNMKYVAPIHHR
ncbi:MAG: hypothetical protein EOO38_12040 [Cytophagaceae bacterium]|nr:MAG: hypothetical protein EOO38_12040 [Cytophagaceae bacterium]